MVGLTDDTDYDAGEAFGNIPRPWSDFGNDYAYNGLRTRCVPIKLEKAAARDALIDFTGHRKKGCHGLVTVGLCKEGIDSPSFDAEPSVLSFPSSHDGHRQSQKP
ncbi:unnamed protein product [Protopolystoma xenopodis]|uniref:Uncharacterized protein n=1 Tax=Protopolystoma xenopodis TaxID=117903 RepID=A0A3S5CR50_9PLAT|nr:unnamed protein product [Protopolystoma xenopodis]